MNLGDDWMRSHVCQITWIQLEERQQLAFGFLAPDQVPQDIVLHGLGGVGAQGLHLCWAEHSVEDMSAECLHLQHHPHEAGEAEVGFCLAGRRDHGDGIGVVWSKE